MDTGQFVQDFYDLNTKYFFETHIFANVPWSFVIRPEDLEYIKNKQRQKRPNGMDWNSYLKWLEEWGALFGCLLSLGPTYVDNNSIFHGWISKKTSAKLL